MRSLALFLTFVFLMGASCCKQCTNPSTATTKYIRDGLGRIVVYHGGNISNYAKHSNQGRAGNTWHTLADFQKMRADGYNVTRFTVFWEAIEPVEGQFDSVYLSEAIAKVKEVQACSTDVIIDMHQDLFAQRYSGNGFPDWMVKDNGNTFKLDTVNWSLNYLQPAVLACFDNFWSDPTAQAKYARALKTFVRAFDTLPGVIGYDVMNEPFPGLSLPSTFEEGKLTKFYERMLTAVRSSSKKLFFFEPWMSNSAGIKTYLKFRPDSLCVYAPHYYNLICESYKPYNPGNGKQIRDALEMKACEARNFGVPMLIGEFGISQRSDRYYGYLQDFCDAADSFGASWTYWAYDKMQYSGFGLLNDDGTPSRQALAVRRVYPQRIAGDNPTWWYNGKMMTLEYDAKGLGVPTVIFIPSEAQNVVVKVDGFVSEKQPTGRPFSYPDGGNIHRKIEVSHD